MSIGDLFKTDLIKTLSAIFLFCVVMAALFLYIWDTIAGIPVPATDTAVLSAAISTALYNLGINHGIIAANGVAKDTATAVIQAQSQPLKLEEKHD